jgi:hypothetical protein
MDDESARDAVKRSRLAASIEAMPHFGLWALGVVVVARPI